MGELRLDPMQMLMQLTGDLSDVRKRVQDLEGQDLAAALEGLDEKVGELKESLAATTEAVKQILAGPEEEAAPDWPGTAPNWTDDLDQDQAQELWDWLTEWCQNILWPIYAQSVWKPCWYRHLRLRIALTWLCAAYKWSYEKGAPPTRAAEWDARWWPHVEGLLQKELADCGLPRDGLKRPKHPVPVPKVPTEADPTPAPPAFTVEDFVDPGFLDWMKDNVSKRREPDKEAD